MSNKVTSKSITINRLVDLYDDVDKPQPAYEFGNGYIIYQKAEKPGQEYDHKFIREKDIDASLR